MRKRSREHTRAEQQAIEHVSRWQQSRISFVANVEITLIMAGYITRYAKYDGAGNCITCGESGRCPGVHIVED